MKPAMVVVLVLAVCLYLLLPPASSGVHLPQARPQDGPQAGALSSGSASEVDRGHTGAGAPTSPAQEVISDTRVCLPLVTSAYDPEANQRPNVPANPTPADGAVDQGVDLALSWIGGDPDGDAVTYHVYLEAGDDTPDVLACGALTDTVCVSTGLAYETAYAWQVVAQDAHGASVAGPVWAFTTTLTPLLDEDFEDGWDGWTPFLNYPYRLAPGQWYWDATAGYGGTAGLTQNAYAVMGKEAEDALVMWLEPGAEEWTDYRLETRIILRTENDPHGVWVRGQYQDAGEADPGGWVTGYYVEIGGDAGGAEHFVRLSQLQTLTDCWDPYCQEPQELYDFDKPHILATTPVSGTLERDRWYTLAVEVESDHIRAWLDGVLYIDYVDTFEPFLTGTVGFKTFKADTVTFDDLLVTPLE